jgi:hypothetical protein
VGEVGEWLEMGRVVGLRDWEEPEEEVEVVEEEEEAEDWWLVEVLRGWLGGGFEGLGGAGAGFLAERVEVKPHGKNNH